MNSMDNQKLLKQLQFYNNRKFAKEGIMMLPDNFSYIDGSFISVPINTVVAYAYELIANSYYPNKTIVSLYNKNKSSSSQRTISMESFPTAYFEYLYIAVFHACFTSQFKSIDLYYPDQSIKTLMKIPLSVDNPFYYLTKDIEEVKIPMDNPQEIQYKKMLDQVYTTKYKTLPIEKTETVLKTNYVPVNPSIYDYQYGGTGQCPITNSDLVDLKASIAKIAKADNTVLAYPPITPHPTHIAPNPTHVVTPIHFAESLPDSYAEYLPPEDHTPKNPPKKTLQLDLD